VASQLFFFQQGSSTLLPVTGVSPFILRHPASVGALDRKLFTLLQKSWKTTIHYVDVGVLKQKSFCLLTILPVSIIHHVLNAEIVDPQQRW